MTKGVFRVKNGWGTEDSVWVQYDDPTRLYELPASEYTSQGGQPPLESLPLRDTNKIPRPRLKE